MAGFSGTAGSVITNVGGTLLVVGGVSEWSLDISHSPVEDTEFGQNFDTYVPNTRNFTGSFSLNAQQSGTAYNDVFNSLMNGSITSLRLYDTNTKYFAFSQPAFYLTGMSETVNVKGNGVTSFNFQGSGSIIYI